jgi:hypothetical protein
MAMPKTCASPRPEPLPGSFVVKKGSLEEGVDRQREKLRIKREMPEKAEGAPESPENADVDIDSLLRFKNLAALAAIAKAKEEAEKADDETEPSCPHTD